MYVHKKESYHKGKAEDYCLSGPYRSVAVYAQYLCLFVKSRNSTSSKNPIVQLFGTDKISDRDESA